MGYSYSDRVSDRKATKKPIGKAKDIIKMMKSHPHYNDLEPAKHESLINYTLRYIANLISPPQFEGEDYDVECVDIKLAVNSMGAEIQKKWDKAQKKYGA